MEKYRPVITGVIGAGSISGIYLQNMIQRFSGLEVKAISAAHFDHAASKAAEYGLIPMATEDLLADPEIELVVILTPADTHAALVRQALYAGKHVYVEKTLTLQPDEARALAELAAEKHLLLGCAPDTFLGSSLQTARAAIDSGIAGEIHTFSAHINRNNDYLDAMLPFLRREGAGVLRDYLVYYLTAIVSVLGPVEEVAAFVEAPIKERTVTLEQSPDFGKVIQTPNESLVCATLRLKNGVIGTIHMDSETTFANHFGFSIYGRNGILDLGDPNAFGNPVHFLNLSGERHELPVTGVYSDNSRGIGPADLAEAIRCNRKPRADHPLACHVLDVLCAMEESGKTHTFVHVGSSVQRPDPLTDSL